MRRPQKVCRELVISSLEGMLAYAERGESIMMLLRLLLRITCGEYSVLWRMITMNLINYNEFIDLVRRNLQNRKKNGMKPLSKDKEDSIVDVLA